MLGGHSSERCEARSGSVVGVLVLPKEDLTLSDAGELAGMRSTDGVGKCLGRCLFAVHWWDLLTNFSLLAFEWISLGEEA